MTQNGPMRVSFGTSKGTYRIKVLFFSWCCLAVGLWVWTCWGCGLRPQNESSTEEREAQNPVACKWHSRDLLVHSPFSFSFVLFLFLLTRTIPRYLGPPLPLPPPLVCLVLRRGHSMRWPLSLQEARRQRRKTAKSGPLEPDAGFKSDSTIYELWETAPL